MANNQGIWGTSTVLVTWSAERLRGTASSKQGRAPAGQVQLRQSLSLSCPPQTWHDLPQRCEVRVQGERYDHVSLKLPHNVQRLVQRAPPILSVSTKQKIPSSAETEIDRNAYA